MLDILIPMLLLGFIAFGAGSLLSGAAARFGNGNDDLAIELRECLPGVNCGACGFSGCDEYARALSEGRAAATNLCTPGGDSVAYELARVLGKDAAEVTELVAYIGCNRNSESEDKKYRFEGIKTCKAVSMYFSGDSGCVFACLGYGDCVAVCPRDAISKNENTVPKVDFKKCVGCGLCAQTCPQEIISLVRDSARVNVKCSNHFLGKEVRKYCEVGCIACGKCERSCPDDAIKVVDNLAVIDYEKCTGCAICSTVCPTGCIHEGDMRQRKD